MTSKTKRRILKVGTALAILLALFFGYRSYASMSRMREVRQLAAQMRNLPPEQSKEAREKMRTAMSKLTPEQRREVFEGGFEQRMKDFFKLSQKDKNAFLDDMIKRDEQRRRNRGTTKNGTNNNRNGANNNNRSNNANANNNNNNGRGGQGQGQGQGRQNLTADQRAALRRQRLDQSTPEQRGMRAAFAQAMQARRAQLGLPSRGR